MGKVIGAAQIDFVARLQGLDGVASRFRAAEKEVGASASAIGTAMNNAGVRTAALQLRVDVLKQKFEELSAGIRKVGAGTEAEYQKMENAARRLEIANQKLANSLRPPSPKTPASSVPEEEHGGSKFNTRFAILGGKDVLEGRLTNALAEAINEVGALSGALKTVGASAIGLLIVGYAAVELKAKLEELAAAPKRVNAAFRELVDPLRTSNDELQVSNDKLENQIAKLEGHRQNTIKLAIDEARVSVDQLSESLGKALSTLQKLLKEEDVGIFRRFLGESGTKKEYEQFFGKPEDAGQGGFVAEKNRIIDRAQEDLLRVKDKESKGAVQDKLDSDLFFLIDENIRLLKQRNEEIDKQTEEQKRRAAAALEGAKGGHREAAFVGQTVDFEVERNTIKGGLQFLEQQRREVVGRRLNLQLTDRKDTLETNLANAKPGQIIEERLQAMRDQLEETQAKLQSVGQTDAFKAQLEGAAAAHKAIDELNKALKETHTTLTPLQKAEVTELALKQKQAEVEVAYATKLSNSKREVADRIASLNLLAEAVGKGYEATRKANVETQLAQKFGESYSDPARKADIDAQRQQATIAYDKEHANQIATTVGTLNEQIKLENDLAAAQEQGAAVGRLIALQSRIDQIIKKEGLEASKKLVQAERDYFEAQQANLSAEQSAKLKQKLADIEALAEAETKGAEAARKAALEAKYAEQLRTGGNTPGNRAVVDLTRTVDQAEHEREITSEAKKRTNVHREQLQKLNEQITATQKLRGTAADQLGVERALRDLEKERIEIIAQQALAVGTLEDGYKAFFSTIGQEAEKPGKILYDGMHHAVETISTELSKALTGQKADWGKAFQNLAQDYVKQSTESAIKKGLGALGDRFPGLKLPGTEKTERRPTGTPSDMVHVYDHSGKSGGSSESIPKNPQDASLDLGGLFGGGSKGGGIFSLIGGPLADLLRSWDKGPAESVTSSIKFPGYAGGTDMTPVDSAYWVGEHGPELEMNRTPHAVIPLNKLGAGGVGDVHINIDARNADIGAGNRAQQAMRATRDQAVHIATQVQQERLKRTVRTG